MNAKEGLVVMGLTAAGLLMFVAAGLLLFRKDREALACVVVGITIASGTFILATS